MRIDIEEKSLYDMIPSQELEVEEQDGPRFQTSLAVAAENAAENMTQREQELASIEEFLRAKKERERLFPHLKEEEKKPTPRQILKRFGQGRPRKHTMKEVTFIQLEKNKYRLAGRGRPSASRPRMKIKLHYRWAQRLSQNSSYTSDELEKMKLEP